MSDRAHNDHEKDWPECPLALVKYVLAALIFAVLAGFNAGLIG